MGERGVMPTEAPLAGRPGRIGLVVAVCGVLFVAANVFWVWYLGRQPTNLTEQRVRYMWQQVYEMDAAPNWLIVGDSSARHGIDLETWRAATGETVVQAGTVADWLLVDNAWMLEEAISQGHAPEKVLMMSVYDQLHRELAVPVMAQAPFDVSVQNPYGLRVPLTVGERWELALLRYVPLYTRHESVQEAVPELLTNLGPALASAEIERPSLYAERRANPRFVAWDLQQHQRFVRANTFKVNPLNERAMARIIALVEAHDIQLYVAASPVYEELAADEAYQAYFADVEAWWRAVDTSSDHVHYLAGQQRFSAAQMTNADHTTAAGAQVFTRALVGQLAASG